MGPFYKETQKSGYSQKSCRDSVFNLEVWQIDRPTAKLSLAILNHDIACNVPAALFAKIKIHS